MLQASPRHPAAWLLAVAGLIPTAASAGAHIYVAGLTSSAWQSTSSVRECRLAHAIPEFGRAEFTQRMGEPGPTLRVRAGRAMAGLTEARVRSVPPSWKRGVAIRELGTVQLDRTAMPVVLGHDLSARLFAELEEGMMPTLFYHGEQGREVAVSLSSVQFRPAAQEFHGCVAQLLSYDYADIRQNVIHFDVDSVWLSEATRATLDRVAGYLRAEPDFTAVMVSGHTDDTGSRRYNRKLAQSRAQAVRAYLVRTGLPAAKIKTAAYGQGKPLSRATTAVARARNRRVTVSVKR